MSKISKLKKEIGGNHVADYNLLIDLSPNREGYRFLVELRNHAKQGHVTFANAALPQALLFSPRWGRFSLHIELRFTAWWLLDDARFLKLAEQGLMSIEIKSPAATKKASSIGHQ